MAGDWLPVDHELPDKEEVLAIAEATGEDLATILGRLFLLWRLFDRRTENGHMPGVGARSLAIRLGGSPEFWQAVASVNWLILDADGATVPDFSARFGRSARQRILDATRKRAARAAERAERLAQQRTTETDAPDGPDAGQDAQQDTGPDAQADTGPDARPDGQPDSKQDAHTPPGVDAGQDAPPDEDRTRPPPPLSLSQSTIKPVVDDVDGKGDWGRERALANALLDAGLRPREGEYQLNRIDRRDLLTMARLATRGTIDRETLTTAARDTRTRNPNRPVAYWRRSVIRQAQARGIDLETALAAIRVPEALLDPKPKPKPTPKPAPPQPVGA